MKPDEDWNLLYEKVSTRVNRHQIAMDDLNAAATEYTVIVCSGCKAQTTVAGNLFDLAAFAGWHLYQNRYSCNVCSEKNILAERGTY